MNQVFPSQTACRETHSLLSFRKRAARRNLLTLNSSALVKFAVYADQYCWGFPKDRMLVCPDESQEDVETAGSSPLRGFGMTKERASSGEWIVCRGGSTRIIRCCSAMLVCP